PILGMAGGDEAVMVRQAAARHVGIDVRRVGNVVALLLQPGDVIDFVVEKATLAGGERPVEGHLDRASRPERGSGRRAVELVQALARRWLPSRRTGRCISGPVVVGLE